MGAQWKQKHREISAKKKGKVVGKIVRDLLIAGKSGGADPDLNPRLYAALEKARKNSVPRDTIDRALKKIRGEADDGVIFEHVTFEGFAPHKIPVIVECYTDNRNRTAPEIRILFKTGSLGTPGSVGFFFNHLGVVEATHTETDRDPEDDAIEAGAQEVEALDTDEIPDGSIGATFITEIKDLDAVSKALQAKGWKTVNLELRFLAKELTELDEAAREEVVQFLNDLDDQDDVQRVYATLK